MMGLEEHLLQMFKEDFEFHEDAAPSHLGAVSVPSPQTASTTTQSIGTISLGWAPEAEKELSKIPFFVRGKARRNTERFASAQGLTTITVDTLYDAKAYYAR
jgi:light-independent protochlorophyllide reductase subunit B